MLAKYLEKCPETVLGKKCIELGAGCGLAGISAAVLGAKKTVLTDFPENLSLLERNIVANKLTDVASTAPLTWGNKLALEESDFDVVLATDLMYYDDAVQPLILTLQALSGNHTRIFMAYGRNRQAEETFMKAMEKSNLFMRKLKNVELDDVYQCVDVDVYELNTRGSENGISI